MRLHSFQTYEDYLRMQIKGSSIQRHPNRSCSPPVEIDRICDYLSQTFPKRGICHGARAGHEVQMFLDRLPGCEIFGTDLRPVGDLVIEWDFNKQKQEWIEKFDFIYTNSLDHSIEPVSTLRTWVHQLAKDGLLFVQWSSGHNSGRCPSRGGNCMLAPLNEYLWMINRKSGARVIDLLYCGKTIVIVAVRRTT